MGRKRSTKPSIKDAKEQLKKELVRIKVKASVGFKGDTLLVRVYNEHDVDKVPIVWRGYFVDTSVISGGYSPRDD